MTFDRNRCASLGCSTRDHLNAGDKPFAHPNQNRDSSARNNPRETNNAVSDGLHAVQTVLRTLTYTKCFTFLSHPAKDPRPA